MAVTMASMSEKTIPARVGVAKIVSSVRRYFAFTNYHNVLCYHMQALSDSIEQRRQSEDKVTRIQGAEDPSEMLIIQRIQGALFDIWGQVYFLDISASTNSSLRRKLGHIPYLRKGSGRDSRVQVEH